MYLPTHTPRRTNARMGLPTYPHRSAAYYYPTQLEKKRNPASTQWCVVPAPCRAPRRGA
jgi:hypothetical protein